LDRADKGFNEEVGATIVNEMKNLLDDDLAVLLPEE
jgi:hypothetical protein